MLRYIPSIPILVRGFFFIMNICWILWNAFSLSIEMIMWFLSFPCWCGISHGLICICIYMLNHPHSWPWNKSSLVFFFCFLGLHPWHIEVLRLGVELQLQLPTYATATASSAGSLNSWARPGIKPASSWILVGFVNCWTMKGTLNLVVNV